jgi:hypothetical protein
MFVASAIMRHFIAIPMVLLFSGQQGQLHGIADQNAFQSVCEIVQNGKALDGQSVFVSSTISADKHTVVMEGPECHLGIYLVHEYNHPGEKWNALDDAVARKGSGLDRRVLRVKVRGIYHNALPDGPRSIRQLKVTDVLEVNFESQ